ncbi:MAG: ATP-grasp domain-containing protein, partial [Planctomycetota bacterium]
SYHQKKPFQGILSLSDTFLPLASKASKRFNLPYITEEGAKCCRNKILLRQALSQAGFKQPSFQVLPLWKKWEDIQISPPVILKAPDLTASQGVFLIDSPPWGASLGEAKKAIEDIYRASSVFMQRKEILGKEVILEEYIHGREFTIDGWMGNKGIEVFLVFVKPQKKMKWAMAETLFITPPDFEEDKWIERLNYFEKALRFLGFQNCPFHLEWIESEEGPIILEVHGRPIGGL